MFQEKFMRFNFEAKPKSSRYSYSLGLSLLHVSTNPVVRHDFGAPLKHTSGIDSWILLHPDERERRCKLTLYPCWLQRVEVASVPVHRCTHVVLRFLQRPQKRSRRNQFIHCRHLTRTQSIGRG